MVYLSSDPVQPSCQPVCIEDLCTLPIQFHFPFFNNLESVLLTKLYVILNIQVTTHLACFVLYLDGSTLTNQELKLGANQPYVCRSDDGATSS